MVAGPPSHSSGHCRPPVNKHKPQSGPTGELGGRAAQIKLNTLENPFARKRQLVYGKVGLIL